MKKPQVLRTVLASAILVALSAVALGATPDRPEGHMGVAKPRHEATIAFERPGTIREILVKEGDEVKALQVLARQDMREELAILKITEHKAASLVSVDAEKAVRDQKKKKLSDLRALLDAVSLNEVQDAELDLLVAEARVELAMHQHDEDVLSVDRDKASIEKKTLVAPIDGVVDVIYPKIGESTEGVQRPVMRIIQNDPLWVEAPVPMAEALKLKQGDPATVTLNQTERRTGKVILIGSSVDTASQTIRVRVEVPNPQKTPSGGIVYVKFDAPNVAKN